MLHTGHRGRAINHISSGETRSITHRTPCKRQPLQIVCSSQTHHYAVMSLPLRVHIQRSTARHTKYAGRRQMQRKEADTPSAVEQAWLEATPPGSEVQKISTGLIGPSPAALLR